MGYPTTAATSFSHPVASPTEATALIDALLSQHKAAFKRKTAVGLYVSISSPPPVEQLSYERQQALRKLGVTLPVLHQPKDSYSVTIRPSDAADPVQRADAQWLWAAIKAPATASAATSIPAV